MISNEEVTLPDPKVQGKISVEEAIYKRRSKRSYAKKPITLEQISQILWAAQGITDRERGYRSAPSPGAKYTIELYLVSGDPGVSGVAAGIYHYDPSRHVLSALKIGNFASRLMAAARDQEQIIQAAATVLISGVFKKAMVKYGERGIQYSLQESGAVGENIYLEATALGLGTVMMGAFEESAISDIIGLGGDEKPLLLMTIGNVE